jgi:hypothetical protein
MKKVRLNSPKPIGFIRAYYSGKAVSGNFLSSGHEKHFDVLDMQSLQLQKAVSIPESEYLEALKKLGEVRSNHVFLADCYFDSPADELDFERIRITDAVFFPKQIPGFMPEGKEGFGEINGEVFARIVEDVPASENIPEAAKPEHVKTQFVGGQNVSVSPLLRVPAPSVSLPVMGGFCFWPWALLVLSLFGLGSGFFGLALWPALFVALGLALVVYFLLRWMAGNARVTSWIPFVFQPCGCLSQLGFGLGFLWLLLLFLPRCGHYVEKMKEEGEQNVAPVDTSVLDNRGPERTRVENQGRLEVSNGKVGLYISDWDMADGDKVDLKLNGRVIAKNIVLRKTPVRISCQLQPGENTLDVICISKGRAGSATPKIVVVDGQHKQKIRIVSDKGQIGRYILYCNETQSRR